MDNEGLEEDSLGLFSIFPTEIVIDIIAKSSLLDALRLCKVSRSFRNHAVHHATQLKQRLMNLIFWYIDTKRPRKAIDVLNVVIHLYPDQPDVYKELGCCWMDLSKSRQALDAFRSGIKIAKGTPYGLILQAKAEWALGNNEAAWKLANEAVEADPTDARMYHFRAFMQSSLSSSTDDRKSQETEVRDYLHILEKIPSYPRVSIIHNNLGYVYYEMKEYKLARHHFDTSIALCPHHIQTYYNKSLCLAETGEVEEAVRMCAIMLQINPLHYEACALKGWINIGKGSITDGVQDYKDALENQENKESYTVIVYTGGLVGTNRFDEAEAYLKYVTPLFEARYEKHRAKLAAMNAATPSSSSSSTAHLFAEPLVTLDEASTFLKQKLSMIESGLAGCYRILAEIYLSTGRFDLVPDLHQKFMAHIVNVTDSSRKRLVTPLLKLCMTLDFSKIRPITVKLVNEYHKLREQDDPEASFRKFQRYLYQYHRKMELCEDEQKYLIACVGHFLLSLFWEGEQYIDTLDNFFEQWTTRHGGFLKMAKNPHYLVNLFDLSTRMENADFFRFLFGAIEGNGEEARLLLRALARLGNNPMFVGGLGDEEDDHEMDEADMHNQAEEDLHMWRMAGQAPEEALQEFGEMDYFEEDEEDDEEEIEELDEEGLEELLASLEASAMARRNNESDDEGLDLNDG